MRLVTFAGSNAQQRLGALIDGDTGVVDLQLTHTLVSGAARPELANVLSLIEAGPEA